MVAPHIAHLGADLGQIGGIEPVVLKVVVHGSTLETAPLEGPSEEPGREEYLVAGVGVEERAAVGGGDLRPLEVGLDTADTDLPAEADGVPEWHRPVGIFIEAVVAAEAEVRGVLERRHAGPDGEVAVPPPAVVGAAEAAEIGADPSFGIPHRGAPRAGFAILAGVGVVIERGHMEIDLAGPGGFHALHALHAHRHAVLGEHHPVVGEATVEGIHAGGEWAVITRVERHAAEADVAIGATEGEPFLFHRHAAGQRRLGRHRFHRGGPTAAARRDRGGAGGGRRASGRRKLTGGRRLIGNSAGLNARAGHRGGGHRRGGHPRHHRRLAAGRHRDPLAGWRHWTLARARKVSGSRRGANTVPLRNDFRAKHRTAHIPLRGAEQVDPEERRLSFGGTRGRSGRSSVVGPASGPSGRSRCPIHS